LAVLDGETGVLLPPDSDGEAIAAVIRDLIGAPERYRAMRKAARAFALSEFNWESVAGRMASEILRAGGPPAKAGGYGAARGSSGGS